ncbi:ATP-dependent helicase, partial [Sphaerochaeta sp. UBA5856]
MELNQQQRDAVTYAGPNRNILVNAGAGSGKTRTIIARAAHQIMQGTQAERILIVTFTNRAAQELRHRLAHEVGPSGEAVQMGTFHAFCLKVMSQLPKSFDISGLNIIDSDDQNNLMSIVRKSLIKHLKGPKQGFPSSDHLLSLYSYSRNTLQNTEDYLHEQTDLDDQQIQLCMQMFSLYQQRKEERGYLDYDDLLIKFDEALAKKPALRHAVCSLFDEVLVDEMQDTNPIQFNILKHFCAEKVTLFCVGDPAQSIYRFRGAEFSHMLEFESMFGDSIAFTLSLNYRSYQEILDVSNWLLSCSSYPYHHKLEAIRGRSGNLVRLEDFESQSDECSWIADQVVGYQEQKIPLSDIMVLYRSSYEAKTLEAELISRKIPYRFIGGLVLTKSAHVRDVFSLLRLVRNSTDDLAWMRYLQLFPRIGEVTAERIVSNLQDANSIVQALETAVGVGHPSAEALSAAMKAGSTPAKCIKAVIQQLSPLLAERYDHWKQRKQDLELLEKVARTYTTLGQFIDDFTLDPMHGTQLSNKSSDDALTLITVHSAKGTEAPICFIASAIPSQYPHSRSLGDLEAEEEERRVLYVACTRAKNELIITRYAKARNSMWVDSSPAIGEAYFLESIPPDLVQTTLHG